MLEPKACGNVVCLGAGPAGLTAAYLLSKAGVAVTVIERDPTYVGGISRTVSYKGFCFDIGGHRFFSKSRLVEDLWDEILGADLLVRKRKSSIYYRGKFYAYPLRAFDALSKLGIGEASLCVGSYLRARLHLNLAPRNFEEWVTNQFGARLFATFFRTYTEKVWGMKCTEISAEWAAQRIRGLSLGGAIRNAFAPQRSAGSRQRIVKTLIDRFRYPRKGPGMMWETAGLRIRENGGDIVMGMTVTDCAFDAAANRWSVGAVDRAGRRRDFAATHVISSIAIPELVAGLHPSPPPPMEKAAQGLKFRDFIVVALMVRDENMFDDHWIYVHDPGVKVARIQNFKSWSPEMVPEPGFTCLGLEYFCFENDGLWAMADDELIRLAGNELAELGLAAPRDVRDGHVIRQRKAYPIYDAHYRAHVGTVRGHVAAHYPNLHLVGRNGMHCYNNQDHAMMTAMLTVKNILAGAAIYDVWNVNQDAEYHETLGAFCERTGAPFDRLVPTRITSTPARQPE
jgi:protoporphyrinogen oxidase